MTLREEAKTTNNFTLAIEATDAAGPGGTTLPKAPRSLFKRQPGSLVARSAFRGPVANSKSGMSNEQAETPDGFLKSKRGREELV